MYKKIVAFSAIFALLFSGCADKSASVKKIDEIQRLYAYKRFASMHMISSLFA